MNLKNALIRPERIPSLFFGCNPPQFSYMHMMSPLNTSMVIFFRKYASMMSIVAPSPRVTWRAYRVWYLRDWSDDDVLY